ncbi:hypothetical protein HRI_003915000 [Hibiscus trionum]|uniref:Mei2-like C-terminal RNA recognition motif domain-containing protein n=1 Tax=Hibiscus trionum TaxID=183268 RepID=A0A9W7IX02_HIBTR|nr:hypothetical protein HRI_003915000 [Hibiscus trionum]
MSASSSPLPVSVSKPLNPSALSYEPRCSKHQFPFQSPQFYQAYVPSFVYCSPWSVYNPGLQPRPWCKEFDSPISIPNDWRKKKSRVCLPPRLRQPRDNPMVGVKKDANKFKAGVPLLPTVTAEEQKKFDGKTSLMIKNIPNHFLRHHLQLLLDEHCRNENLKAKPGSNFCKSAYDFLYLPMDFMFGLNLGYAFVNFTTHVAAWRFCRAFDSLEWSCRNGRKKICRIGIAKHQGKDALKENFQYSYFACHSNEYLPVVYSPARDGFNRARPSLVGRRIRVTAAPNDEKIMIMTKRKIRKL